jgi:hypothetical protein
MTNHTPQLNIAPTTRGAFSVLAYAMREMVRRED